MELVIVVLDQSVVPVVMVAGTEVVDVVGMGVVVVAVVGTGLVDVIGTGVVVAVVMPGVVSSSGIVVSEGSGFVALMFEYLSL